MEASSVGIRAIVVTDMVGSTMLRDRLGEDRADQLRRDHYELLQRGVSEHRGRVLHWTGDGVQADFRTASEAVAAALDIQRAVDRYGQAADAVSPFQIRIGVAVGEVVVENDDDSGAAIVEAVRLEALCAPGEILVTELVAQLGRRRVAATFEEAGEQRLKGFDRAVMVFRVIDTRGERSTRSLSKSLTVDRRFPLVGRSDALAVTARSWQQACSGVPRSLLITGRSGMGKSRLLAQVADRAHLQGANVLVGVCDAEFMVPYQPIAMALRDLAADDPDVALALADGEGPLGPLFATRRRLRPDEQGPSARFELFEAVAALVTRVAAARPLLFVLEDLQWAEAPTVQLLRHLMQHVRDGAVLLLGTYRAEEVAAGHPLHELLAEIESSPRVQRITLAALNEADVAEMISARVPGVTPGQVTDFARRVTNESAGSPFFVSELLHHLATTGELQRLLAAGDLSHLPIPDTVRDVVEQRLSRLSEAAGQLLATASLLGLTFDLELIAQLVDRSPDDVLDTIEEVMRATLVHEIGVGRFSFSHAIVRSTLVDRVSATRRSLGHRRIAEAIERLDRRDHEELAHHWELAGNIERAIASVELAAQRDLEALAYESAAGRYAKALDHHVRSGVDHAAIARTRLGLALAKRGLGDASFLALVEFAGRYARRARDRDLLASAALASLWPGTFFIHARSVESEFVELCEDALASVPPDDHRRVALLTTLAGHLSFDPQRGRRIGLLAEALERARAQGEPVAIGNVLVSEYLALWDPTTFERRHEIALELNRIGRATGDITLELFARFFAAFGATERGLISEARRMLATMSEIARGPNDFYFRFLQERLSISIDVLLGLPGSQERVDDLAARYAVTHADTDGTWAVQTAGLAIQAGTLHTLVGAMKAIVESSDIMPTWMPAYGVALLANGDVDEANAVLDQCGDLLIDYFWLPSMQALSELAIGLGRTDRCRELYEVLMPFHDQLGVASSGSFCYGFVATTLGLLALSIGDAALAFGHLEGAMARADAIGAAFESVKSRRGLAEALALAGRPWNEIEPIVDAAWNVARTRGFTDEQTRLLALRRRRGAT